MCFIFQRNASLSLLSAETFFGIDAQITKARAFLEISLKYKSSMHISLQYLEVLCEFMTSAGSSMPEVMTQVELCWLQIGFLV